MTKSELKTGMIVTLANGSKCMVFRDAAHNFGGATDVIVKIDGSRTWMDLYNYNEDMTIDKYTDLNIVKVEKVCHPYAFITPSYEEHKREILWTRKKQYTYAQLREILGEEL